MEMKTLINRMEESGVIPVIKLQDINQAEKLAAALIGGGIMSAEVTFRAEGADKVISAMVKKFPQLLVGAGTVTTVEQVDRAVKAGAHFCVAPGLNPKVVKHCLKQGVPFIPGVATSGEIEQALELGLEAVKFFPAEQAGGLNYIKAVSAPYQSLKFMPTGGVNENNILEYLSFNKVFCCGGSWMVPANMLDSGDFEGIERLSRAAMNKIHGFELAHIGVNCADEKTAKKTAALVSSLFGFEQKEGASSIFASSGFEIMKSPYLGKNGHIAVKTNSITRAVAHLKNTGVNTIESSAKYDEKKNLVAVYLDADINGFAVHLLQKK